MTKKEMQTALKRVEKIRASNNKLWMQLVGLVVSLDEKRGTAILRQIVANDAEIGSIMQSVTRIKKAPRARRGAVR